MAQDIHVENKSSSRTEPVQRLLIVDEDAHNQESLAPGLEQHGYQARFLSSGGAALLAIQKEPFDLVFFSLSLPDMTGRELCQKVRLAEATGTRLPLIAMVNPQEPVMPVELFKWGLDDYITKPYNLRQISRMAGIYAAGVQAELPDDQADEKADLLDVEGAVEVYFAGNLEDYREMLGLFIGRLPKRMERMRKFFGDGAYKDLARECHSVKSITASLGAQQLSRLANRMESYCEDGRIRSSPEVFQEIEKSMEIVLVEARSFLGL